eukprot:TRINITY_DN678_c0_g1_i2.p1 TRINITY_DN678_c0_g1~~TRINITY_DN678_c0_g1_i2.p1  ORF type:complete len:106 (+),score=5.52 TRINITY_DN678_c0_g1_i2:101-418(+)
MCLTISFKSPLDVDSGQVREGGKGPATCLTLDRSLSTSTRLAGNLKHDNYFFWHVVHDRLHVAVTTINSKIEHSFSRHSPTTTNTWDTFTLLVITAELSGSGEGA